MFNKTSDAIAQKRTDMQNDAKLLSKIKLLVDYFDTNALLNDAFATFDPNKEVVIRKFDTCRPCVEAYIGFERCGTGECVEVLINLYADDDTCTVKFVVGSTLLNYNCEYHAPTPAERAELAAMLYGALKVHTA